MIVTLKSVNPFVISLSFSIVVVWSSVVTYTYQSDEDAEELDDVGVSHTVKTTEESVEDCNAGTEYHAGTVVHVDDDAQCSPCGTPHIIPISELTELISLLQQCSTAIVIALKDDRFHGTQTQKSKLVPALINSEGKWGFTWAVLT
jgi:hypothetical protein